MKVAILLILSLQFSCIQTCNELEELKQFNRNQQEALKEKNRDYSPDSETEEIGSREQFINACSPRAAEQFIKNWKMRLENWEKKNNSKDANKKNIDTPVP